MGKTAIGHLGGRGGFRVLVMSCILFFLFLPSLGVAEQSLPAGPRRTLRTVHDLFLLNKGDAVKGYPVELEAVVTYSDPEWGLLFVQDPSGSTYIDVHGSSTKFAPGSRVRINGLTTMGYVSPEVAHPKITVLGPGMLPNPAQKSVADLDAGGADSSWVVTEGVLHPCEKIWNRICFHIVDGKKLVWLIMPLPDGPEAQSFIGARVQVRGVCGSHLDAANKRVAAQLFVNNLSEIHVESPPLLDTSPSPPIAIQELRASDADQRFVRQYHLRGTVTWRSPGLFSVEDRSGAVFVEKQESVVVHTGTTVDVIGFPSHGEFGLELSDSSVRLAAVQTGTGGLPPLDVTAEEAIKRLLNGRRVHLNGRLISQSATATGYVYQFEDGDLQFSAALQRNDATRETVVLTRDSILELTGVAIIHGATPERPATLLILIDSPANMVVRGGPGWLTLRRALIIVIIVLLCVLTPLLWGTTLRRTVHKQTVALRQQADTIQARLQNELQLEKRFRRLFERNLAAVYTWRSDGLIVDCNLAFVRLLGFQSREELIGRSYWDFQVDAAHREQLGSLLPEEGVSNREATLRRGDGAIVELLMNITPVESAEGIWYETTAIDVTLLRQHQAELQRAKDAAVYDSLNDPLTGLPNRRFLAETLTTLLAEAHQDAGRIALLYLDLDGFKLVNDSLGHSVGDGLLIQLATRLRAWVREGDLLARLGGDEFMVIMNNIHAREDAVMLAKNLLEEISTSFEVKGHTLSIAASIGISIFPDDAANAEELMQQADSAMYSGKRGGKNRVTCFTPEIGSEVRERLTLEHLLRGAIARREIFVHYQPEFDLADLRLTRFEALARWTHPTLGRIPPDKFIPIAEESGMIDTLGAYILEQACAEAVRWQTIMPDPIQIAVNVSSLQFRRKGFVEEVRAILERTKLAPDLLQIEITESAMVGGFQQTAETIHRLRLMGISMAIDDFGTGYSNLSYLPSLDFDALKIDRSFVTNLDTQPESESMIRTLIALAHEFAMVVIVEGVETEEQLAIVKRLGANEVQGYLTGRPTATPEQFMMPDDSSYEFCEPANSRNLPAV
jgi:diguanylate cyclase (GGDEF)-like protein/PAS domain S-box-containing protein